MRARFWIESGMAALTALLLIMTLISREWIEILFGVSPDGNSGSLEWFIVAASLVSTVLLGMMARSEWRRRGLAHRNVDSDD